MVKYRHYGVYRTGEAADREQEVLTNPVTVLDRWSPWLECQKPYFRPHTNVLIWSHSPTNLTKTKTSTDPCQQEFWVLHQPALPVAQRGAMAGGKHWLVKLVKNLEGWKSSVQRVGSKLAGRASVLQTDMEANRHGSKHDRHSVKWNFIAEAETCLREKIWDIFILLVNRRNLNAKQANIWHMQDSEKRKIMQNYFVGASCDICSCQLDSL